MPERLAEGEPWFQRLSRGSGGTRLYCFPFAGGGTAAYMPWLPLLGENLELRAARLPGRLERLEPPRTDLAGLAAELAAAITAEDDGGLFALFGHSMGGVLAFEVARCLHELSGPEPAILVVSASTPPHLLQYRRQLSTLPDGQLSAELYRIGGIPDEIMAEPEMLGLLLPTVRADLRMLERYRPAAGAEVACQLLLLGGRDDKLTSPQDLLGWRRYTTGASTVRTYPGGHFYLSDYLVDIVDAISTTLARIRRSPTR